MLDANDERSVTQIVHVNRLKPFISTNIRPDTPADGQTENPEDEDSHSEQENSDDDDDPNELAVKAILNKKTIKNRSGRQDTYYLVQWEDDDIEPSWKPLKNLHCSELVKQFEISLFSKKTN